MQKEQNEWKNERIETHYIRLTPAWLNFKPLKVHSIFDREKWKQIGTIMYE